MSEEDVERFLWELERSLSHLDGEERLGVVREAERLLHDEAARVAADEGAADPTWYHYVQASASLGPPDELAARLTGKPVPVVAVAHRRLWSLAGLALAVVLGIVAYGWASHGALEPLGTWSGEERGLSAQRHLVVNVSGDASSVFLRVLVVASQPPSEARMTVLDGGLNTVYAGTATPRERLEFARYLEGAPGTWRILIDFQEFTGGWRVQVDEERP